MASYKQHTRFNCFIGLPTVLVFLKYFFDPTTEMLYMCGSSFIYATLFMNPDMDLAYKIRWFSLRGILATPFRSYARFFRHRGLSHHLLFGSLTRVLWLYGWFFLGYFFCAHFISLPPPVFSYNLQETQWIFLFLGICFADWCHLLLDSKYFFR